MSEWINERNKKIKKILRNTNNKNNKRKKKKNQTAFFSLKNKLGILNAAAF